MCLPTRWHCRAGTDFIYRADVFPFADAATLFRRRIPWTTLASERPFRAGGRLRRCGREVALTCAEISPSPVGWVFALAFDIDGGAGEDAWREAGICVPNFVVGIPGTARCHLIYVLRSGVDLGNPRAVRYLEAIRRAYLGALYPFGADSAYAGRSMHNPFSGIYAAVTLRADAYDLDELAVHADFYAPLPVVVRRRRVPLQVSVERAVVGFRNVTVFDACRFAAYAAARGGGAPEAIRFAAEDAAESCNSLLAAPLGEREIGGIVASVVGWTIHRVRNRVTRVRREVVGHAVRIGATASRIVECRMLRAAGYVVSEIACRLGVTVRTIWRYLRSACDTNLTPSGVIEGGMVTVSSEAVVFETKRGEPPARPPSFDVVCRSEAKHGSDGDDRVDSRAVHALREVLSCFFEVCRKRGIGWLVFGRERDVRSPLIERACVEHEAESRMRAWGCVKPSADVRSDSVPRRLSVDGSGLRGGVGRAVDDVVRRGIGIEIDVVVVEHGSDCDFTETAVGTDVDECGCVDGVVGSAVGYA